MQNMQASSPPPAPVSPDQQIQLLLNADKPQEAEAVARSLLQAQAAPLRIWQLLILALRAQRRYEEIRNIQAHLVNARPFDLSMRFDLAETSLMLGDFDRGWKEYHYRYSLPHTTRIERKVQVPRWDGSPMPGKTLLIHDEQGFGDTFQFIRMVPWAKKRSGARVVLEIGKETLPFAQRLEGIDQVVPYGELPPPFDSHCELMSLPMAMGLKMSDLPGPMPYLKANPDHIERWKKRLADLRRPLIALTWSGRPFPNPRRSIPLETLAPLAKTGFTFVSIQKGHKPEAGFTIPEGLNLIDLESEITDFEDTAAIMSIADLSVSIDSAPIHLAGAMGRPGWLMLLYNADWRWLHERADSPWYPSLRLFRQPKKDDWESVINRISDELKELSKEK